MKAREIVAKLNAIRREVQERTPAWYMLNRFTVEAMDLADKEEREAFVRTNPPTKAPSDGE